jgi:hypothetical protein
METHTFRDEGGAQGTETEKDLTEKKAQDELGMLPLSS